VLVASVAARHREVSDTRTMSVTEGVEVAARQDDDDLCPRGRPGVRLIKACLAESVFEDGEAVRRPPARRRRGWWFRDGAHREGPLWISAARCVLHAEDATPTLRSTPKAATRRCQTPPQRHVVGVAAFAPDVTGRAFRPLALCRPVMSLSRPLADECGVA
jgi:hypothetical protein